jgi:hypothetical protein
VVVKNATLGCALSFLVGVVVFSSALVVSAFAGGCGLLFRGELPVFLRFFNVV